MNDYLLLTPGPLTTSDTVKQTMLKDWCTWDDEYNLGVVQTIRQQLLELAGDSEQYTSVLMQGSGTASVESAIGSTIRETDKLLVIANGAYGDRIAEIACYLKIDHQVLNYGETRQPDVKEIDQLLSNDTSITHVAMVHCETTTGILNPIEVIIPMVKSHNRIFILDAMSSFGGIPLNMAQLGVDVLISSANKCIQGVPGFGFVIARRTLLEQCEGVARSLSLDLYDQWQCMEKNHGKWRFTSPTHTVRAFAKALEELAEEGGIEKRHLRYQENQRRLVEGMEALGFKPLLPHQWHSPIITSFYSPDHEAYQFKEFYSRLKTRGFVIYPGKVSNADCFRIGNIGEVYPEDVSRLLEAMKDSLYWL